MAPSSDASVSFDEPDTRSDEMHSTIEQWIDGIERPGPKPLLA